MPPLLQGVVILVVFSAIAVLARAADRVLVYGAERRAARKAQRQDEAWRAPVRSRIANRAKTQR